MQYRKKHTVVEAKQWFKHGDHPEVRRIEDTDDMSFIGMAGTLTPLGCSREELGVIGTIEDPIHLVSPGDWIIRSLSGKHFPYKPDIFEATYEPVEAHQ